MGVIIPFKGRSEFAAEDNLRAFVDHARICTPLTDVAWESSSWDLTLLIPMKARGTRESRVYFTSWRNTSEGEGTEYVLMQEPYLAFAKAAFSEAYRRFRERAFGRWIYALRAIEMSLVDLRLRACVTEVTPAVLSKAEDLIELRYSDPWSVGRYLERLINEIVLPAGLIQSHFKWKSRFKWKAPTRNDEVNSDNRAAERLPDPRAFIALGEIHRESKTAQDHVVTSFCALAMFAPSRGSEILSLPVRCTTSAQDDDQELMGLQWQPAKGGTPITKFSVSDDSASVAQDAIQYLIELGAPARAAAAWYAKHPTELYLPPGYEQLRGQPITLVEIAAILGKDTPPRACYAKALGWRSTKQRTTDRTRFRGPRSKGAKWVDLWDFKSVEKWVLNILPKAFPILDRDTTLLWEDALFVLPMHVLKEGRDTLLHVPYPVSIQMINHHLGSMPNGTTIFARNKKLDPDAAPWVITSQQFRHFLNTLAQSKYLSQELIAFWSGRRSVAQNLWYDHVPQEAVIEGFLKLAEGAPKLHAIGPLADKAKEISFKESISYDDALKVELGAIHITKYGLCRHDYALTPCPKDKDCISCGEHVFTKGDPRHYATAVAQRDVYRGAVRRCEEAIAQGEPGAQTWFDKNIGRLKRWEKVVQIMEDDSIPNGTLVSLPPPETSQVRTDMAMEAAARDGQTPSAASSAEESDDESLEAQLSNEAR